MADPASKGEDKAPAPSWNIDIKKVSIVLFWILAIIMVAIFAYFIVLIDEQSIINFMKFLNILEVILGLYLVFLLYKLYTYTEQFKYWGDKIGDFYGKRYAPEKKEANASSPIVQRFEKAKQHISSNYKEEWKIGVIELDNILRDLLVSNGYLGETVAELLNDGLKKGMQTVEIAWEAHKVRNKVVHEGVKYAFSKESAEQVLRKYTTVFEELKI